MANTDSGSGEASTQEEARSDIPEPAYFREVLSAEFAYLENWRDEGEARTKLADITKEMSSGELPSEELTSIAEGFASGDDSGAWQKLTEEIDGPALAEPVHKKMPPDLFGLAFSGGGIRSAAFNLGVFQAIARLGLHKRIDYLSTVSGGGYIGSCISSIYSQHGKVGGAANKKIADKYVSELFVHQRGEAESTLLSHLRSYSNYLAPESSRQLLAIPVLMIRGIIANLYTLLPGLLILAAVTIGMLQAREIGLPIPLPSMLAQFVSQNAWMTSNGLVRHFPLTLLLALLSLGLMLLSLSGLSAQGHPERSRSYRRLSSYSLWFLLVLAFEAHVLLTSYVMDIWHGVAVAPVLGISGAAAAHWLIRAAGPDSVGTSRLIKKVPVTVILGLFGVLCLWGLVVLLTIGLSSLEGVQTGFLESPDSSGLTIVVATALAGFIVYLTASYSFDVNYTSIHNFYRDRLSRAFVVAPIRSPSGQLLRIQHTDDHKLQDLGTSLGPYHIINATHNVMKTSKEYQENWYAWAEQKVEKSGDFSFGNSSGYAPPKGRDGDIFIFSPCYIGSDRLGYCSTEKMELRNPHINLATAMAISGAAAAPNMGQKRTGLAALTLALFNVRLNYWLSNPRLVASDKFLDRKLKMRFAYGALKFRFSRVGPRYLINEMLGKLDDDTAHINISDGGHSENLGAFELLKRRCKLIIVGDGECDPQFQFHGLMNLIRIAQMDLSIKIEMQGLDDIREGCTRFAIGTITYKYGAIGKLIYLKSSLPGDHSLASAVGPSLFPSTDSRNDDLKYDETTYLGNYKARHPDFPHQTTADQFFDEEQFECYRALGYTVAMSALGK